MRKIREVLRLHFECGCQHRQIALACEISPSTVSDYLSRAERAGVTWEHAKPLSDADVGLLVDQEWTSRENRRVSRRVQEAMRRQKGLKPQPETQPAA